MAFPETLLDGMQVVVGRKPLDGRDVGAVRLHCKHRARLDGFPVDEDGTRAADARFAPDVSARQPARIAKKMHEQGSRLDLILTWPAVDVNTDGEEHRTPPWSGRQSFMKRTPLSSGQRVTNRF